MSESAYIPGTCNINTAEIAYRRKWRNIGAVSSAALLAILLIVPANRWLRLFVFLPAFIGAIGYLQTKNKFCVGYAAAGQQNADEGSHKASTVDDQQAHALDKAKASKMNRQAALIAVIITVIALVLPHV